MIMPRRDDPLLMPVDPLFVWGHALAGRFPCSNIIPLGRMPAMPNFLALVLVSGGRWAGSRRVGVGVAFAFGLLMDVHSGAVLGQHALAYTLLSYFAVTIHGRLVHGAVAGGPDPAALLAAQAVAGSST